MNTTTKPSSAQPAIIGGVVMGVLSALPIISAGNLCCCMWVIAGGMVAAYLLQQNSGPPISHGDGALVGLLAGIVGAFVYLLISIPITMLVAPMERQVMQRLLESSGAVPPEWRDFVGSYAGGGIRMTLGFILMLFVGSIFSTLGGFLGAVLFGKKPPPPGPPGTIDVTPQSGP